jgi:hypothetical protein
MLDGHAAQWRDLRRQAASVEHSFRRFLVALADCIRQYLHVQEPDSPGSCFFYGAIPALLPWVRLLITAGGFVTGGTIRRNAAGRLYVGATG